MGEFKDHFSGHAVDYASFRPGYSAALYHWTYTGAEVSASIDAMVNELYNADIGPYWPPERKMVEQGYANLAFPWPELPAPRFVMEVEWSLDSFVLPDCQVRF